MAWKLKEEVVKTEMGELETAIQIGKLLGGLAILILLTLIYLK